MDYRYIARIKVEATTPLFVGSGDASLITDSLVIKDHHGLPIIPGTSLAGVLRHSLEASSVSDIDCNDIFGYQGKDDEGLGSRLVVSSAYLLLNNGKVAEGISGYIPNEIVEKFKRLPTRQHVRINEKGVADKNCLFDNEVVYAGAQFIFEVELKGSKADEKSWKEIIKEIKSPTFRIGQGTRNGYGNLKVIEIFEQTYQLTNEKSFNEYLNFNASFNASLDFEKVDAESLLANYTLEIEPDDFFIFSEGFGDNQVDNKPITEEVMVYENNEIKFIEKTLIPASSIKGTIAHRVAFHYNKQNKVFADQINTNIADYLNENNPAVARLFGKKGEIKEIDDKKVNIGQRGILLMDDLYFDDIDNSKIFNHVAIDRFTGGGIDGALFSEKVSYKKDKKITLKIYLSEKEIDEDIIEALEEALKDICRGLLPLGGMTTKGFGMFTGKLLKKEEEIFNYDKQKIEA